MLHSFMIFRSKSKNLLVAGVLFLFVASAIVGRWVAYDPSLSWSVLLAILISLSIFWIIAGSLLSPWSISRGLVIIAGLFAFYFIFQYRHFDFHYAEIGLVPSIGRLTSSFSPNMVIFTPHPNDVASFLEGVLLVSLVVIGRGSGRVRWVWIILTLAIAYALFISESRGAWLGIIIAMVIWILLIFHEYALKLIVIGLGFAGGLIGGIFIVTRLMAPGEVIPLLTPTLYTASSRLTLYQNSLQLMKDYPFTGIGLGDTFGMVYSRYQLYIPVPFLSYAHNLFLSVSLGQGLLGLITLIGILILFYTFVIRVERTGIDSEPRLMLFRAAWLGVTASLIHGFTDSAQFSDAVWTMPVVFALAGIAVSAGRPAMSSAKRADLPVWLRYFMWATGGIIVGFVLMIGGSFWRPLVGVWYANWGSVDQTRADLSPSLNESAKELLTTQAVEKFEQALKIDPDQPTAHRRLGLIALEKQDYKTAIFHLERAYARDPKNQATLKPLGYAYLWTGQLDAAESMFRQMTFNLNFTGEMEYWHWKWREEREDELSAYAGEMARRLSRSESANDDSEP